MLAMRRRLPIKVLALATAHASALARRYFDGSARG